METVIERLRSPWVIAYVDDVIVHTLNLQQHMEELRTVFKAHQGSTSGSTPRRLSSALQKPITLVTESPQMEST